MPEKTVTPEKVKPVPPALDTVLSNGFNFSKGRWEGNVFGDNADKARDCLEAHGLSVGVFEGEDETWDRGTKVKIPYFRVFVRHKSGGFYTWWRPSKIEDWKVPTDFSLATWYEYKG